MAYHFPLYFHFLSMPIFSSTSHVQINGGTFIETQRDFNLHSIRPSGNVAEALTGLEFSLGDDCGRPLVGAERTERAGRPRMRPFGASENPLTTDLFLIFCRCFKSAADYVTLKQFVFHLQRYFITLIVLLSSTRTNSST
jgi:hypothetical protein